MSESSNEHPALSAGISGSTVQKILKFLSGKLDVNQMAELFFILAGDNAASGAGGKGFKDEARDPALRGAREREEGAMDKARTTFDAANGVDPRRIRHLGA